VTFFLKVKNEESKNKDKNNSVKIKILNKKE
jgi:hypothetical protein